MRKYLEKIIVVLLDIVVLWCVYTLQNDWQQHKNIDRDCSNVVFSNESTLEDFPITLRAWGSLPKRFVQRTVKHLQAFFSRRRRLVFGIGSKEYIGVFYLFLSNMNTSKMVETAKRLCYQVPNIKL